MFFLAFFFPVFDYLKSDNPTIHKYFSSRRSYLAYKTFAALKHRGQCLGAWDTKLFDRVEQMKVLIVNFH